MKPDAYKKKLDRVEDQHLDMFSFITKYDLINLFHVFDNAFDQFLYL